MAKDGVIRLAEVRELAEQFARNNLEEYINEFKLNDDRASRKEINDAVWGTISLSAIEVIVLDSPLLQRLRYIRQLGVVHWIYPGAMHSRFEHTIGVVHQIQHLTSAINNLAIEKSIATLSDLKHTRLLRLSAILHDVGHAAFSHVSEKAVQSMPQMNSISADFSKEFRVEGKQLSEIFAFYIIRSPAMRSLFAAIMEKHGDFVDFSNNRKDNITILTDKISDAIIGRKIDDRLPLLHELISGPFDADKLDYFVRDARLAGTPSVLDISRLVQKISIRELDSKDLPPELSQNVDRIEGKHCLFGIKWSGVAVLDELHLARILLYTKIYRHPKVASVEQMLKAAITLLCDVASVYAVIKLIYAYEDDALLMMTRANLIEALELDEATLDVEQFNRIDCAAAVLKDIKRRRIVVKAFQVQKRYPADPLERNEEQSDGLTELMEDITHPTKVLMFKQELLDEVQKIRVLMDPGYADNALTKAKLEAEVMVYGQARTPGGPQIARAFLLPTSGEPIAFSKYIVNRTVWVDSYTSDQPAGYIFSKSEIADIVYIATEVLVRKRYKIRLPQSALELGKRDATKIQTLKKRLATCGYYKQAPFDIRPIPDRFNRADVSTLIDQISANLSGYHEPQNGSGPTKRPTAIKEKVTGWLRQFDTDGDVECALRVLSAIRMLDRTDTVGGLQTFIEANSKFRGAIVVPFGDARDSGVIQTYFSADLIPSHIAGCKTLDEVVNSGEKAPVIFIDDFLGSGGQAQDILAAGFGMSSLRRPLGEKRDMFSNEKIKFLKERELAFVFTAAWNSGIASFRQFCKQLELNAVIHRHIEERDIPFAFDGCLAGIESEAVERFKERCTKIGKDLIASLIAEDDQAEGKRTSAKSIRSKQDDRALGYGNRGMLLVTPFNVPTQSLTALWATGAVDGVDWNALLPRRKKR